MLPIKRNLLPTVSRFIDDDWNSLFDWNKKDFSFPSMTLPAVNVKETKEDFVLEIAAPGMKKEDFKIELKDNILTVKSDFENEKIEKEGEKYTRKEFSYHSFQRSFNLNDQVVDDAKISAVYQDGILSLTLPKKEEVKEKPARSILID